MLLPLLLNNLLTADAPAESRVRSVSARARNDTAIVVRGRIDTAVVVAGRIGTVYAFAGSLTVAIEREISFKAGEHVTITATGEDCTGLVVKATVRDGATGELLCQSTADIDDDGIPTAEFTHAQTVAIPDGSDEDLPQRVHAWDMAIVTSGSEASLVGGRAVCKNSPTLQA
jgi:hypothetical protein